MGHVALMAYLGAVGTQDQAGELVSATTVIALVVLAAIAARLSSHGGYVYVA